MPVPPFLFLFSTLYLLVRLGQAESFCAPLFSGAVATQSPIPPLVYLRPITLSDAFFADSPSLKGFPPATVQLICYPYFLDEG